MKSQELFALLVRDRAAEKTSTRQQIAYRMQAEGGLGPDENLFKIEHVSALWSGVCNADSSITTPMDSVSSCWARRI
jgi:paired amphipathic helix protein Sin3a